MASELSHPMDNFPVRPLKFEVDEIQKSEMLWSKTCPEFSMFINALGMHVPYFERYLIKALGKARKEIKDPALNADIGRINGQEAHHAKNFISFNAEMAKRYPKMAQYEEEVKDYFAKHAKEDSLKELVGFTAGYETFTFLAGAIILQNYDKWMADSDPTLKAMWVWHQVEEIEHGAVAFNVYRALYGKHEWFRKWKVVTALSHIAYETLKAYTHMAKVEGWLRNPLKGAIKIGFCCQMLMRLLINALPVFRKSYHPYHHPIANQSQNKIQIAWRKYEAAGGNVLAIDREKMAEILGVELPLEH